MTMNKLNSQKGFVVPLVIAIVVIVIAGIAYSNFKSGPTLPASTATSTDSGISTTSDTTATKPTTTVPTAGSKPAVTTQKPVFIPSGSGQAVITSVSSLNSDNKFYSGGKILIKGRNLGVCNYPNTAVGCYIRAAIGSRDGAVISGTADQTVLTVDLPSLEAGTYNVYLQYPSDKNRKQSNDFPIVITGVTKPSVTLAAPNGDEILKIGSEVTVSWKVSGPLPAKYWTLVTLGSDAGGLIKLVDSTSPSSFTWTIPTRIQNKTSITDLAPGSYKVTVSVYDGPICFNSCIGTETGKLIVQDESDSAFSIVGFNTTTY